MELVDATCPFVKKIHNIVNQDSKDGRKIIIIGDITHPEVQGIMGWCNGEPVVVDSVESAEKLSFGDDESISVVSQTTFNHKKFNSIV